MESLHAEPADQAERSLIRSRPAGALAVVVAVFVVLAVVISIATPPWEANDEPDHLRNVNTLVAGSMYRIGPSGGLESHQPPLYYVALAGLQRALGIGVRTTYPAFSPLGGPEFGNWDHRTTEDGANQRYVSLMRLSGIVLGIGVILATYLLARRVSRDRWTPVVAAALVATLPKFVFLSAVVNNDDLANLLGALVILGCVRCLQDHRAGRAVTGWHVLGLGLLVGLAVATKLTCVALLLPVAMVMWQVSPTVGERIRRLATVAVTSALPVLPWIVFNLREYDEPLASRASGEYFDAVIPGLMRKSVDVAVYAREIPQGLWKTFWYSSGWNQFEWSWWAYLPFWALLLPCAWLGLRRLRTDVDGRATSWVFASAGVASLGVYVYIATITTGTQARVMFVALPALAVVTAIGSERWHTAVRFVLPVLGVVGTLVAFRDDVLQVYFLGV